MFNGLDKNCQFFMNKPKSQMAKKPCILPKGMP